MSYTGNNVQANTSAHSDMMKEALKNIAKTLELTRDAEGNKRKASCTEIINAVAKLKRGFDELTNEKEEERKRQKVKLEEERSLDVCVADIPAKNKAYIDSKPDIPAQYGIQKYQCFRDNLGVKLMVVGFDSSRSVYNITCLHVDNVMSTSKELSQVTEQRFRTSFVAKQLGTIDTLQTSRVHKFWNKFGGEPYRTLQMTFRDQPGLQSVNVIDMRPGGCKRPVLVKRLSDNKQFCVTMKMLV